MYTAEGSGAMDVVATRDQPICDIAKACWFQFNQLLQLNSISRPEELATRLSDLFPESVTGDSFLRFSDIHDEYEQFRVWSRNLGVFASDHGSLDYRLREALDVRDGVLSLLNTLREDLQECFNLIQQDRIFDGDDVDSDSSDSGDSMDFGDALPASLRLTKDEIQNRFQNVSDTITNLIELAGLIRKSGAKTRSARADAYEHVVDGVNYTKNFENDCLPLLLKHRFELSKLNEPLLDRFCKAIGRRRRQFLYQAEHQKRLAYGDGSKLAIVSQGLSPSEIPQSARPLAGVMPAPKLSGPGEHPLDSTTEALTKATTLKRISKARAASTMMSSSRKFDSTGVDLPPPPGLPSTNATHFECPYCCVLVPAIKREKSAWRKHLITDLRPFICIEPECPTPDAIFEKRSEWIDHQKWQHAMEWWCDGEDGKHTALRFSTEEDFVAHRLQFHLSCRSRNTIEKRVEMAGHPSLTPFTCCPFCDFLPDSLGRGDSFGANTISRTTVSQKALQDHIAEELLRIFLIALPEVDGVEDEVSEKDTERSLGTRSTVRQLSTGDDTNAFAEESMDMLSDSQEDDALLRNITNPGSIDELWAAVWASPQLRNSVRESYGGPGHDDTIKHIAIHRLQHIELENAQVETEIENAQKRQQLAKSLSDSGNHYSAIKLYNDLIEEQTASSRASFGRTERHSSKMSDLLLDLKSGLASALAAFNRYGEAAQILRDVLRHRRDCDPSFDEAATRRAFGDHCNSLIKQDTPTALREARDLLHQQSLSGSRNHDGNADLSWALENSVRLVELSLEEEQYGRAVQVTYFICLHRYRAGLEASRIEERVRKIVQSLLAKGRKDHALHVLCHWSGVSADSGESLTDCIRELDSAKVQDLLGDSSTRTLTGLEVTQWRDLGWELSKVLLVTERYTQVISILTELPELPKDVTGGPTEDQVLDLQLHCQLRADNNGRASSFSGYNEIAQEALGLFNKYGFATTIPSDSAAPDISPAETLITTLQRMVSVADRTGDPQAAFKKVKDDYWTVLFQRAENDHSNVNTAMMWKLSELGNDLSKKWVVWRVRTRQKKPVSLAAKVAEEAKMVQGWVASTRR